jgi:hypothetical protein
MLQEIIVVVVVAYAECIKSCKTSVWKTSIIVALHIGT